MTARIYVLRLKPRVPPGTGFLLWCLEQYRNPGYASQITNRDADTMPAYWLLKSEPDTFSWDDLVSRGDSGESWDGVRNFQARNNMRAMKIGDLGFFYHSNIGKDVVGVLRVIALAHPESGDESGKWDCVDVKAVASIPKPVSLDRIKNNEKLADMVLVTNSRLSVQPVTAAEWNEVCRMGGLDVKKLTS